MYPPSLLDRRFANDVAALADRDPAVVAAALAEAADDLGVRGFLEEIVWRARLRLRTLAVIEGGRR